MLWLFRLWMHIGQTLAAAALQWAERTADIRWREEWLGNKLTGKHQGWATTWSWAVRIDTKLSEHESWFFRAQKWKLCTVPSLLFCTLLSFYCVRVAVDFLDSKTFCKNSHHMKGEALMRKRHLEILGYRMVQVRQYHLLWMCGHGVVIVIHASKLCCFIVFFL